MENHIKISSSCSQTTKIYAKSYSNSSPKYLCYYIHRDFGHKEIAEFRNHFSSHICFRFLTVPEAYQRCLPVVHQLQYLNCSRTQNSSALVSLVEIQYQFSFAVITKDNQEPSYEHLNLEVEKGRELYLYLILSLNVDRIFVSKEEEERIKKKKKNPAHMKNHNINSHVCHCNATTMLCTSV